MPSFHPMKRSRIPILIVGLLLFLASIWLGAWGQEVTGGVDGKSWYAVPALVTAIVGGLCGIGMLLYAMIKVSDDLLDEMERDLKHPKKSP